MIFHSYFTIYYKYSCPLMWERGNVQNKPTTIPLKSPSFQAAHHKGASKRWTPPCSMLPLQVLCPCRPLCLHAHNFIGIAFYAAPFSLRINTGFAYCKPRVYSCLLFFLEIKTLKGESLLYAGRLVRVWSERQAFQVSYFVRM